MAPAKHSARPSDQKIGGPGGQYEGSGSPAELYGGPWAQRWRPFSAWLMWTKSGAVGLGAANEAPALVVMAMSGFAGTEWRCDFLQAFKGLCMRWHRLFGRIIMRSGLHVGGGRKRRRAPCVSTRMSEKKGARYRKESVTNRKESVTMPVLGCCVTKGVDFKLAGTILLMRHSRPGDAERVDAHLLVRWTCSC